MLQIVSAAPPDSILGLTEAFKADPRPDKINLSVGQYKDCDGNTPVLASVKQAEQQLLEREDSKGYLPIDGLAAYDRLVPQLMFGRDHPWITSERCATLQTPGGTGALRVAADFLHHNLPKATVWLSQPTWPNHPKVFAAAAVPTQTYPYLDSAGTGLDCESMMGVLQQIPRGDVVLLHACCHNPTGVDPKADVWAEIGNILQSRGLLPLIDFAYQGLGFGLEEDAIGLRALAGIVDEMLVCNSFSKNFGLYRERVGALTVVTTAPDSAQAVLSQLKACVRTNYSNPPSHGAAVVATILQDAELRKMWEVELEAMRSRINQLRRDFVATMRKLNCPVDFDFVAQQKGMFSFSGLTPDQVDRLRTEHSIYIVGNGRINVAGLREDALESVGKAIIAVLKS